MESEVCLTKVPPSLPDEFLANKLAATLEKATQQLRSHDPAKRAQWIVYVVLNLDNLAVDHEVEQFRQIDDYLAAHSVADAQVVFVPAKNVFERIFTMRSATVDQE